MTEIESNTSNQNITTHDIWNNLSELMFKVVHLPSDIQIDIKGSKTSYRDINRHDIKISDDKVWVQLDKQHTLTLFERQDFDDSRLAGIEKPLADYVMDTVNYIVKFSQKKSLKSLI